MNSVGKSIAKVGLSALHLTAAHRLMAPFARGLGVVLMFHRVRPWESAAFAPNAQLEVTPDFLAAAVRRIRQRGVDIVDLDEARRRIDNPSGARRFAVITMDDGYADNFEHAYPVLTELDCPFTVYVATGLIDREAHPWWRILEEVIARQESTAVSLDGPVSYFDCRTASAKRETFRVLHGWLLEIDEDRQRQVVGELAWRYGIDAKALTGAEMMTWDQVRELAADPLVTIGAHTIGHYALAKLPEARARAEMRDGARVLEAATGTMPRHFAYPYGNLSAAGPREYRIAAELGFSTAVTTLRGMLRAGDARHPTALPRVAMDGNFQSVRYVDLFLSGVPFAFSRRPAHARVASGAIKAVASN